MVRPHPKFVNQAYNGVAKAISATQPEGALKAEALPQIKCNPREVSYRIKSVVTLQSALPRLHTQLRGTCESYQFGTNTTPHPRLECFHSIDSCSTQPHETWVISHDYTETHSPIKPGLGSLFFNSSPNPKHAPNNCFRKWSRGRGNYPDSCHFDLC